MRNKAHNSNSRKSRHAALLDELQMSEETGNAREVLRVANLVLAETSISAKLFNSTLEALIPRANDLEEWTRRIEDAFSAMSLKQSKKCRSVMLRFYRSIRSYQKALEFIPARFSGNNVYSDMTFTLHALLATNRIKKADALVPRALRIFVEEYNLDGGCELTEALTSYFGLKKDWDRVAWLWESETSSDASGPLAWLEIASARLAQATEAVDNGLRQIRSLRSAKPEELAFRLPANFKAGLDQTEMEFRTIQAGLHYSLPPEVPSGKNESAPCRNGIRITKPMDL